MQPRIRKSIFVVMLAIASVSVVLSVMPAQAAGPTPDPQVRRSLSAADVAATWVVTSSADSGAGTLRAALATAAPDDTITFNGDMTITLSSELVISQSVTIDGEAHAVTISGNHATRVFNVTASTGTISFAHLTIADGDVQTLDCGDPYSKCGSGIMLRNSGVAVMVTNSTLISNTAYSFGGGIYNAQGLLKVQNSTFVGNTAGAGGGLYNAWGQVTMTTSTFSGNSTSGTGGGLYSYAGIVTMSDSRFLGNGDSTANQGGAIYNYSSIMTVTNSTFSGNFIQVWGGAISNDQGPLTIANSTFSDNRATLGQGGGIKNWAGALTVINSTFSGNSAYEGGGLLNASGTLTVLNSTFSGNAATNSIGGGLENWFGTVTITNSLVANSLSGGNCAGSLDGANNLADDESCGTGFINSSTIRLGSLGDYTCPGGQCQGGGSTPTIPLLPGSSAIDATGANCPATDQRGVARGTTCDLGAFESQGFILLKAGGDSQSTPINTTFAQPLVISVTNAYSEPVNGGVVTFVGPLSGVGSNPITTTATITNGAVAHTLTANGLPGSYSVDARATGATAITFRLTNLVCLYLPLVTR